MSEWPSLSVASDHETLALLHLVSQMLGKIRVAHAPWVNHGWHVTLRPNASGLATLPTSASDGRTFTLALDLCRNGIALQVSDGASDLVPFAGKSVAQIQSELIALLDLHALPFSFNGRPNEIADAIPFARDTAPRNYDPESARRLHDSLQLVVPIFERFRAGFTGKASPVHFFWGSFDLAVTRFSGRTAPKHPGGVPGLPDRITREAYDRQLSSAGFWASGVTPAEPFFYSYAYPEPDGYRKRALSAGGWNEEWQEFTLPYEEVRKAADPVTMLTGFLHETYEAAADLANWDRTLLEREPRPPR
jgi:hypothetical protein